MSCWFTANCRSLPTHLFYEFVCRKIFKTSPRFEHGNTKSDRTTRTYSRIDCHSSGQERHNVSNSTQRTLVARARPLKISTNKPRSKNCTSRKCDSHSNGGRQKNRGRGLTMSALPLKANMCGALGHVCFGPIADIAIKTGRLARCAHGTLL